MLTLQFNKSRSKNLPKALSLAKKFTGFNDNGDRIEIKLVMKEVFEKWEAFWILHETVITWKGTILSYDGLGVESPIDQWKITQALGRAHEKWIEYVGNRVLFKEKIIPDEMTNEQADLLIDLYCIKTNI